MLDKNIPHKNLVGQCICPSLIKKKYLPPRVLVAVLYIVIDVYEISHKNCGNEIKWQMILAVVNAITFISFTGTYEHIIDQFPTSVTS